MNPAETYIFEKSEPYKSILIHLDAVIRGAFPELKLKYKWKLPFYYLDEKTMFCYLNFRKTFIDVGLPYGNLLSNAQGILIAGEGRKMMRSLRFTSLEQIDETTLIEILEELKQIRQSKVKKSKVSK